MGSRACEVLRSILRTNKLQFHFWRCNYLHALTFISTYYLSRLIIYLDRPKSNDDEDFYFTDLDDEDEAIEMDAANSSPPLPPTLSHSDMARPPHEDPEYQRKIVGNIRQGLLMSGAGNGQTYAKASVAMSSQGSNTVIHNYAAWSQTSPVSQTNDWVLLFDVYFTNFSFLLLELSAKARQIVTATVHIVCTISIANILHIKLSNSGPTVPFNAIIISRIYDKVISQFATTTATTTPTKLGNAPYAHQVCQSKQQNACVARRTTNARREQEVSKGLRDGQSRLMVHSMQVEEGVQPFRRLKITKQ